LRRLIHPVVAGQGEKFFENAGAKIIIQLINNKADKNGNVMLHYQKMMMLVLWKKEMLI
jgi:hypothetical protein